jgi:hypothetical protein
MTTMFNELTDKMNLKDLEETLVASMPLLAVVGAGDLAVEKLKTARDGISGRTVAVDPQTLREQAQSALLHGIGAVQAEAVTVPDRLRALPDKAQEWPARAQELPARAQALFAEVLAGAFSTYGELAGRGKSVVEQVRAGQVQVTAPTTPVTRPAASSPSSTATKPAAKTTAKKPGPTSTAKKSTAKKSTAQKSTAATSTAKKSTAKKSTAKTATARKSTSGNG